MKAMSKAETAPISSDPTKIRQNCATELPISSPTLLLPVPAMITVSYITIETASLKIDSPNTIAYRFSFAFISLNMARTATGSVALIRLPKANASFQENTGEAAVWPTSQNMSEDEKMAMKVPRKEKAKTVPKFLKNGYLFML